MSSTEEGIDPIGSCVGQKGTRVQTVIEELGGEKIDIILWNDDVAKFIASALSPAKVLKVDIKEAQKDAVVSVPEDQLSLAIGKRGQNVRLAAKLTGWKIDIMGVKIGGQPAAGAALLAGEVVKAEEVIADAEEAAEPAEKVVDTEVKTEEVVEEKKEKKSKKKRKIKKQKKMKEKSKNKRYPRLMIFLKTN